MTTSTRFKLSIFSAIILTIVGICAYIYNPENIDKFAFYTINMVLPVISYVVGRTIRTGREEKGLLVQQGTRYRTALITFITSLMIGIICYIFSPENIDKLGMYMIGVVLPIVGFIIGRSFKGEQNRIYEHDYNNYDNYQYVGGNINVGGGGGQYDQGNRYNYGNYKYDGGASSEADNIISTPTNYGAEHDNEEP